MEFSGELHCSLSVTDLEAVALREEIRVLRRDITTEVVVLRDEIGVLRRDLGELHTEVAALRGDVAGFRGSVRGSVGETSVPRDWWATTVGIDEFFDSVPEPGREGGSGGRVGGVGRGRDGRGGGAGGGRDDKWGGGRDMGARGRDRSAGGVTEGTLEVVVEGVAEDERTPEMTDDDVAFVSEGVTERTPPEPLPAPQLSPPKLDFPGLPLNNNNPSHSRNAALNPPSCPGSTADRVSAFPSLSALTSLAAALPDLFPRCILAAPSQQPPVDIHLLRRRSFNRRCSGDYNCIDDILLSFEPKLRGSDDYTLLLRELGNRGKWSFAMRAYAKSGYCDEAIGAFETMKDTGLKSNLVTFNALINVCGKGGADFKRASMIFDEMFSNGVQPDRITYNLLLTVSSGAGLWETARSLLSEMVCKGIDQDIYTYNTLLDAACSGGPIDVAFEIMSDMLTKNILPNEVTTVIHGCAKAGRLERALSLFNEMKFAAVKLDRVSYNTLPAIYASLGRNKEALNISKEMESMGIEKDVVTFNALLDGFGKEGILFVAVEYLESWMGSSPLPFLEDVSRDKGLSLCLGSFPEDAREGNKANVVTFSAILNACSHCSSFEEASLLLEELCLFDNHVYGVAHGLLMGGHNENVWLQARSLFDAVKQMDTLIASAFYNALTDMLWHFGIHNSSFYFSSQKRGAQLVVLEGKHRQVWKSTWSESCLDLHVMSSGAARAMVHAWLLIIQSIVFEGQELPKLLSILTGWGKHSKVVGDGALKRAIEAQLTSMGALFQIAKCNIGRFISTRGCGHCLVMGIRHAKVTRSSG
ncbi:Hypothetical predicted protein [Olea europaea subsp. europaea]|uniref:Smr domain-containing protein n=1 Tax=Olea europaea subsp. europaea TaxID=158383 RepID=A0A8S0QKT6_OLEEU|nr:Hypothetical predicted protein [Olea europaea subsp. europaea]